MSQYKIASKAQVNTPEKTTPEFKKGRLYKSTRADKATGYPNVYLCVSDGYSGSLRLVLINNGSGWYTFNISDLTYESVVEMEEGESITLTATK